MATDPYIAWEEVPSPDLLVQARAGCREAVQEFITRNEKVVRWLIRRRLEQRCLLRFGEDDLVQEIRLGFLTRKVNPEVFQSLSGFFNYLLRAVVNKIVDVQRRWLTAQKRNLNQEIVGVSEDLPDGHEPAGLDLELHEEAVDLYFLLPEAETPVYFMLLDRASPAVIARHLEMSRAAVYRMITNLEGKLCGKVWN